MDHRRLPAPSHLPSDQHNRILKAPIPALLYEVTPAPSPHILPIQVILSSYVAVSPPFYTLFSHLSHLLTTPTHVLVTLNSRVCMIIHLSSDLTSQISAVTASCLFSTHLWFSLYSLDKVSIIITLQLFSSSGSVQCIKYLVT